MTGIGLATPVEPDYQDGPQWEAFLFLLFLLFLLFPVEVGQSLVSGPVCVAVLPAPPEVRGQAVAARSTPIWNAGGAGVLSGMPGSDNEASLRNVIACS
jgi:hypothetical protein